MSQHPLAALPSSSPQTQLKPMLKAALGSLDVQLEDELTRYRCHRAGMPLPPPRGLERQQSRKTLDLISVGAPSASDPDFAPTNSVEETSLENPFAIATSPNAEAAEADSSSLVLSSPEPTPENLATAPEPAPDDYLESSEELLKNLSEPEEELATSDRTLLDRLLTPLGIGALLLLLAASATLGFVLKNPALLSHLIPGAFKASETPTNPTAPASPESQPTTGTVPQAPNLADREFGKVNLDTLSTLQTGAKPSPRPSTSPAPKASTSPQSPAPATSPLPGSPPVIRANPPATTRVQPSGQIAPPSEPLNLQPQLVPPQLTPAPVAPPPPAPEEEVTPPEVVAEAPTSEDGLYYAIANYDSDRTLEQAREIVPDAYLRDFPQGTMIQLGAFSDEAAAQALIDELQSQGITAEVYRP